MSNALLCLLCAAGAYLIGSVNFGILISRIFANDDVRKHGSGSAGATNMLRTYGKLLAVLTLLLDAAKGYAAFALSQSLAGDLPAFFAGLFAVIGHCYPLYFKFRGGKGVATILGVGLALNPIAALSGLLVALGVAAVTKYMSLGSILGVFCGMLVSVFTSKPLFYILMALVFLLCVWQHRANIQRLASGTENKLAFKKPPEQAPEVKQEQTPEQSAPQQQKPEAEPEQKPASEQAAK